MGIARQTDGSLEGHVQVGRVGRQSDQSPRPYLWRGHRRVWVADAAQYGWWCCPHVLMGFVDHSHLSWPIVKGTALRSQRGSVKNGGAHSHARDSPRGLVDSPREGTL